MQIPKNIPSKNAQIFVNALDITLSTYKNMIDVMKDDLFMC